MNDDLNTRIDDLLALAALGELSPADELELDAALAADAELVTELDADLSVAAALQATLATEPPASMKANVMAAIDALDAAGLGVDESSDDAVVTMPQPATSPLGTPSAIPADTASTNAASNEPGVVDFASERTKRRTSRWQPLAAAAAVALLFVGGVLVANRGGDDGPNFEAIAQADDAQQRTLAGELDGTLEVVYSPSQQSFVIVGTDIPTLIDAETYQLWFVDGNGAQSVGLFRPDDQGRVEQVFTDLDPSDFVVGVTIEPAAGSESPTLPIIAAA